MLRFQSGLLAFPEFKLYSNVGYVTIAGTKHCIICASPPGQDHYIACPEIGNLLKTKLKHLKLSGSIDSTPLFTRRGPGHEYSWGALDTDTRQLIKCVLGQCTGLLKPRWNESKALSTMSRVVGQLLEKHRYTYNGMINTLYVDDRGDDVKFLSAVAHIIFQDGTVNWGRVASLTSFGAAVCQYLKDKGRDNCVEVAGEEISAYLVTHHKDWLNGFVEFFPVAEPESRSRNIIMTPVGLAGIGAAMTLLVM
uniref:Bcl-2 Bcl-2 homology region 1-3 domain-containing protein n=1 Tax=Salmo trutta TaxID=8032 RepID=A0A674BFJ1_SALTR